jgi:hypothetical protein
MKVDSTVKLDKFDGMDPYLIVKINSEKHKSESFLIDEFEFKEIDPNS